MSTLKDIEARAAARPKEQDWTMHSSCDEYRCQCHNDLDRVIAIAKEQEETIAALHRTDEYACAEELEKTRTAALMLRVALQDFWTYKATKHTVERVLADTEWLEEHRG